MLSGFIPQLFSSVFPNPEVLWDLMEHSGAQALVYDDVFNDQLTSCQVPVLRAVSESAIPSHADFDLKQLPFANQADIALIVHSSGTTSGMPKIIPVTHGWLASFVTVKYQATLKQGDYDDCNVTNTLGNLAHVGSITGMLYFWYVCQ
jgi:acyl-coenzyme A synthetase/AMP-(fatty) acid ligase